MKPFTQLYREKKVTEDDLPTFIREWEKRCRSNLPACSLKDFTGLTENERLTIRFGGSLSEILHQKRSISGVLANIMTSIGIAAAALAIIMLVIGVIKYCIR